MRDVDLAYAAGLIDGEGSILLSRHRKSDRWRWPMISVTSTTRELVDWFRDVFGGTICNHKTYKAHHKPHWSWRLQGRSAINVLEQILPYMKEPSKLQRARMLVEEYLVLTPRNGRYTPEAMLLKQEFESRFLSS